MILPKKILWLEDGPPDLPFVFVPFFALEDVVQRTPYMFCKTRILHPFNTRFSIVRLAVTSSKKVKISSYEYLNYVCLCVDLPPYFGSFLCLFQALYACPENPRLKLECLGDQ